VLYGKMDKRIIYFVLVWGICLFLCRDTCLAQDWNHAPKPQDYSVKEVYKGKIAPVILDTKKARMFRTVLRQGAKAGPNFAGHYTMVAWGCGLGSFELAIIDAKTGRVYFPPFGCITLAGGIDLPIYGGNTPNPGFRLDSKLFVILGIEDKADANPGDRAAKFYVFDKGKFKLVYSIPAPLSEEDSDQLKENETKKK
jgi:hypothetical protein